MAIMKEIECVKCIKNKPDGVHFGVFYWPRLVEGERYIFPPELAQRLEQEGYISIIKPDSEAEGLYQEHLRNT